MFIYNMCDSLLYVTFKIIFVKVEDLVKVISSLSGCSYFNSLMSTLFHTKV